MTLNLILLRLPLGMGIIGTCHQAQLLQHREPNPEIHACLADTLPAQLYLQPCLLSDTSLGCIIREMVDGRKERFLKTNAFPASCMSLGFKIIFQRNPLNSHIPLWDLILWQCSKLQEVDVSFSIQMLRILKFHP